MRYGWRRRKKKLIRPLTLQRQPMRQSIRKQWNVSRKTKNDMLAFYDFPAARWQHIRTSNSIESTFATVRLRTAKTRGCVARHTILSMVFTLGQSAQKRWRRLRGFKLLADVIQGVQFKDGEPVAPIVSEESDRAVV